MASQVRSVDNPQKTERVSSPQKASLAGTKQEPGTVQGGRRTLQESTERRLFAVVPLRKKLYAYLATSTGGLFLDVFSTLLSALALLIYVLELYDIGDVGDKSSWSWYLELVLSSLFAVEWSFRLYLAPSRVRYVYSIRSIVDILTVVPIFATAHGRDDDSVFVSFLRVLRVLRVLRLNRLVHYTETEVQRLMFFLGYTVASVIFVTAGILEQVERKIRSDESNGFEKMHLHDAIYLICITISTVGYGDVSPRSNLGRFVIIMMLCVTFTVIPYQMNQLATVLGLTSVYRRLRYRPRSSSRHVLVFGDFGLWMVENFCDEFFHEDHGFGDMDAVLVSNNPPAPDLALYMRTCKNARKIKYIEGSPMDPKDLDRTGAATARACFFLCNKFCKDDDEEDSRNIMLAMSVWQYISGRRHVSRLPRMLIQLIKPENKHHLLASMRLSRQGQAPAGSGGARGGGWHGPDVFHDQNIVCIDEMKLNLMGQNLRCPGLSTLLTNLVRTCSEAPPPEADEELWMYEYAAGASHEVYRTTISPHFTGWLFEEVAEEIYREHGCLLIGLELVTDTAGSLLASPLVLLAPFGFRLTNVVRVLGFVLAHNVHASMLISDHVPVSSKRGAGSALGERPWGDSKRWPARGEVSVLPSVEGLLRHAAHKLGHGRTGPKSVWSKKYQVADSTSDSAVMSAHLSRNASFQHAPPGPPGSAAPLSRETHHGAERAVPWFRSLPARFPLMFPGPKKWAKAKPRPLHVQPLKTNPGLYTPLGRKTAGGDRTGPFESPTGAFSPAKSSSKSLGRSPLASSLEFATACEAGTMVAGDGPWNQGEDLTRERKKAERIAARQVDPEYMDPDIVTRWAALVDRALDDLGQFGERALKHDLFAVIRRLNKLQEMYYLTPSRDLADCTLHQVTFSGHILVCGPSSGLQYLIAPLRRITLPGIRPVVVLYKEPPLHQEWETICMFPDVYFVEGTPSNASDLFRANISQAHRAVILARGHAGALPAQAALADAETIFTYQHMRSLNPRLEIVCELVSGSSLTFLQPFHHEWSTSSSEFYFAPLYAAGLVYVSSMLDTLICQAFFNKHIVGIIHELISGLEVSPVLASGQDSKQGSSATSKQGSSTASRAAVREAGAAGARPEVPGMPGEPASTTAGDSGAAGGGPAADDDDILDALTARKMTVLQIGIPEQFFGASYGAFFAFMVGNKRIPLGLFRAAHAFGNSLPYVYTNPQPNTIIMRDDRAFVISEESSTPGGAKVAIPLAGLNRHGSEVSLHKRGGSLGAAIATPCAPGSADTASGSKASWQLSKDGHQPASARTEISEISAGTPGPQGASQVPVGRASSSSGGGNVSPSRSDSLTGQTMKDLLDLGLPSSTRSTPMSQAPGLVVETGHTIHEEGGMSVAAGQALRRQHERSHEVLVQLLVGMQSRVDHQVNGLRRELQELQKIIRNK
eukprot:jgi/Mesvir1/22842/Mv20101-RA.1